jgi:hypothetical protein
MQYPAAALLALATALAPACTDATADDAPRTCGDVTGDYWLELSIDGLHDQPVALFGVESEGVVASILRTPSQRNGFSEARLPGDRWLTIVVFDDTVRVFIQERDGQVGPADAVLTIAVDDQRTRTELRPTYDHAMVGAVQCDSLVPTLDTLSIKR